MSPGRFNSGNRDAYVFRLDLQGYLYLGRVDWTEPGVRPVINIRSDAEITGSGTTSDPFKVVGAS